MIKKGVILFGIKPAMVMCDGIVQGIFNEHGYECVRTSIVGKKHRLHSLHPVGYAVDYRIKHMVDSVIEQVHKLIVEALPCCDVLIEYLGKPQAHFHVEFDPKDDVEFQRKKKIYRELGAWPNEL